MKYELHPATHDDQPFLEELFADVRAPEFAALSLPPEALKNLLAMQSRAQQAGYAAGFPLADHHIVRVGPYRVGRLLVSRNDAELRLVDLALLSAFRGQGLGERILQTLCAEAAEAGLPLRLTVRRDNPAARLYRRLGLRERPDRSGLDLEMEWTPASPNVEQPSAASESGAEFRPFLGRSVRVCGEGIAESEIVLREISALPGSESFVLSFAGPAETALEQGTYTLRFSAEFEREIFLGPVRETAGVREYAAVFNRATPPEA